MTAGRPTAVHAVRYARADSVRSRAYLRYERYGEPDGPRRYDFFFWIVETPAGPVLFDTGFEEFAALDRGQPRPMPITDGLDALSIAPADVRVIVLSHLHYDHCGNLGLFPNAEIVLQQREWDFTFGPVARRPLFADVLDPDYVDELARAHADGRVRLVDGDTSIGSGLDLIALYGHSAGSQGLLVHTADGTATALASDAGSFVDCWRRDRPLTIALDVAAMYQSYDRLRALEQDGYVVVPGHDDRVAIDFPTHELPGGVSVVQLAGGGPPGQAGTARPERLRGAQSLRSE